MDVLLIQQLSKMVVEKFTNTKTTENENDKEKENETSIMSLASTIIGWIIVAMFGAWAAYLSWTANTLVNWNIFAKVIFSLFAALNGIGYLISYLIFKWDLVSALALSKPLIGGRR
jgi:predicted Na+-dependent transporter